jgi:aquaporin Z
VAPDLVRGDFGTTWICVDGLVVGALIGGAFEWILKGKPTASGAMAAQDYFGVEDSAPPEK